MIDRNWHLWFAWRPVRSIEGEWLWLRVIERKINFLWCGEVIDYREPVRRGVS